MTDQSYINMMREAAENNIWSAVEAKEYNLVATLGLVPFKDGGAWCVLWGENLHTGISGFGDTPYQAVLAFNRAVHAKSWASE